MATPEGTIQLAVMKYLKSEGVFSWRNNNQGSYDRKRGIYVSNPYIMRGVPDIIAVIPAENNIGQFVGFEVKTPKGRQSPDQKLYEKRLTKHGGRYFIVRSVADAKQALLELGYLN